MVQSTTNTDFSQVWDLGGPGYLIVLGLILLTSVFVCVDTNLVHYDAGIYFQILVDDGFNH